MSSSAQQEGRPGVVTVMAWIWVGAAGLLAMSALGSALMNLILSGSHFFGDIPDVRDFMPEGSVQALMAKYYGFVALIQLMACGLMVWSSLRLLKGKYWARISLEVFSWLGIAYALFGGYIGIENLKYMDAYSPELVELQEMGFDFFDSIMLGVTIVSTIAFMTPFVISAVVMRKASIRNFCTNRGL